NATAARRIGEDPVRATAVVRRAEFLHVLADLIHGELLGSELVRHALGLGIAEVGRRGVVPNAAWRFLAVVFAFEDGELGDFAAALRADADVHHLGRDRIGAPVRI